MPAGVCSGSGRCAWALVAVAAAVFQLDDAAGLGQAGDDPVGAAFGDAQAGRDAGQAHPGLCARHSTRAWLARKARSATNIVTKFRKSVASFWMRA